MKKANYIFATFFGSGYFPFAPGTFASIIAGLIGYLALLKQGISILFALFIIVAITGFISSGVVEQYENQKDPSIIVIDEAAGMLVSMLMVSFFTNNHTLNLFLSFLFFRIFDITKVYPVGKMEKIGGGAGIMLDDIVAGILAGLSVLVTIFVFKKAI